MIPAGGNDILRRFPVQTRSYGTRFDIMLRHD